MFSYGCQQILINPDQPLKVILEVVCEESNKLANCGSYYSSQFYFKKGKIKSRFDLHRLMKDNPYFNALYSQVAQQTLTRVAESLKQGRLQASEAKASLDVSDTSGFNRLESFFINSQAFALLHAIK
jgi:lycopene cyclase CruP